MESGLDKKHLRSDSIIDDPVSDDPSAGVLTTGQEIIRLAQILESSIANKWNDDVLDKIESQGNEIIALADDVKITNDASYTKANELILRIKQYGKENLAFCEPFKKAAKAPGKLMDDIIKKIKNNHDKSLAIAGQKVLSWKREQDRIREETQRKLDAERARREAAERDKLMRQAEKAEAKGQADRADDLVEQAAEVYVPPVVAETRVAKTTVTDVGKTTTVPDWYIEISSAMDVIKAVAAGRLPITMLEIKTGAIKTWARSQAIKSYTENGLRINQTERISGRWNKG